MISCCFFSIDYNESVEADWFCICLKHRINFSGVGRYLGYFYIIISNTGRMNDQPSCN